MDQFLFEMMKRMTLGQEDVPPSTRIQQYIPKFTQTMRHLWMEQAQTLLDKNPTMMAEYSIDSFIIPFTPAEASLKDIELTYEKAQNARAAAATAVLHFANPDNLQQIFNDQIFLPALVPLLDGTGDQASISIKPIPHVPPHTTGKLNKDVVGRKIKDFLDVPKSLPFPNITEPFMLFPSLLLHEWDYQCRLADQQNQTQSQDVTLDDTTTTPLATTTTAKFSGHAKRKQKFQQQQKAKNAKSTTTKPNLTSRPLMTSLLTKEQYNVAFTNQSAVLQNIFSGSRPAIFHLFEAERRHLQSQQQEQQQPSEIIMMIHLLLRSLLLQHILLTALGWSVDWFYDTNYNAMDFAAKTLPSYQTTPRLPRDAQLFAQAQKPPILAAKNLQQLYALKDEILKQYSIMPNIPFIPPVVNQYGYNNNNEILSSNGNNKPQCGQLHSARPGTFAQHLINIIYLTCLLTDGATHNPLPPYISYRVENIITALYRTASSINIKIKHAKDCVASALPYHPERDSPPLDLLMVPGGLFLMSAEYWALYCIAVVGYSDALLRMLSRAALIQHDPEPQPNPAFNMFVIDNTGPMHFRDELFIDARCAINSNARMPTVHSLSQHREDMDLCFPRPMTKEFESTNPKINKLWQLIKSEKNNKYYRALAWDLAEVMMFYNRGAMHWRYSMPSDSEESPQSEESSHPKDEDDIWFKKMQITTLPSQDGETIPSRQLYGGVLGQMLSSLAEPNSPQSANDIHWILTQSAIAQKCGSPAPPINAEMSNVPSTLTVGHGVIRRYPQQQHPHYLLEGIIIAILRKSSDMLLIPLLDHVMMNKTSLNALLQYKIQIERPYPLPPDKMIMKPNKNKNDQNKNNNNYPYINPDNYHNNAKFITSYNILDIATLYGTWSCAPRFTEALSDIFITGGKNVSKWFKQTNITTLITPKNRERYQVVDTAKWFKALYAKSGDIFNLDKTYDYDSDYSD